MKKENNLNYWICVIIPGLLITYMAYIQLEIALGMIASLIGIAIFKSHFANEKLKKNSFQNKSEEDKKC